MKQGQLTLEPLFNQKQRLLYPNETNKLCLKALPIERGTIIITPHTSLNQTAYIRG